MGRHRSPRGARILTDQLTEARPHIDVVAAVIERDGRLLVTRRPAHKQHGDCWEFPGGKVDAGETLDAALARELREELDITLTASGPVLHVDRDIERGLTIHFFSAIITGEPRLLEHTDAGWYTPDDLMALELAPADARFAERLRQDTRARGAPAP